MRLARQHLNRGIDAMQQAVKKARQSQQERSSTTTAAIMEAAIALLFETGFSSMTMAQVAKRAGASQGAITHHYGHKEGLVLAAGRFTIDKERRRLRYDLPQPADRVQAIDAYFDASEQFFLNRYFIALLEIFLAARRNQKLSAVFYPLIGEHRELFDRSWQTILERAGLTAEEARQLISTTNSMLRGIALQLTRQKSDKLEEDILSQCRVYRSQLHRLFD